MQPAAAAVRHASASSLRTCLLVVCICIILPHVSADAAARSPEASGSGDSFSRSFLILSDDAIETFVSFNNLSASLTDLRYVRFFHEHERLLRGLVVPLLFDQRITLIFFRYHALTTIDIGSHLDSFVDAIDQASLPSFLFHLCVCPSWPMYKVPASHASLTYILQSSAQPPLLPSLMPPHLPPQGLPLRARRLHRRRVHPVPLHAALRRRSHQVIQHAQRFQPNFSHSHKRNAPPSDSSSSATACTCTRTTPKPPISQSSESCSTGLLASHVPSPSPSCHASPTIGCGPPQPSPTFRATKPRPSLQTHCCCSCCLYTRPTPCTAALLRLQSCGMTSSCSKPTPPLALLQLPRNCEQRPPIGTSKPETSKESLCVTVDSWGRVRLGLCLRARIWAQRWQSRCFAAARMRARSNLTRMLQLCIERPDRDAEAALKREVAHSQLVCRDACPHSPPPLHSSDSRRSASKRSRPCPMLPLCMELFGGGTKAANVKHRCKPKTANLFTTRPSSCVTSSPAPPPPSLPCTHLHHPLHPPAEFCPNGDLTDAIHPTCGAAASWPQRLLYASQIASGAVILLPHNRPARGFNFQHHNHTPSCARVLNAHQGLPACILESGT